MADLAQLDKTRQAYRTKLTTALEEEEDPLAAYETFIKWTIDSYPATLIPKSGLLELLEEATRQFKDDAAYKGDLRYTKLWMLYAAYVDDERTNVAVQVYKFLVQNEIGKVYAQVYEEYAAALERVGRIQDAEKVFLHGIKRKARPTERLKKRHAEFQARAAVKAPAPPRAPPSSVPLPSASAWRDAPSEVKAIRKEPLKNFRSSHSKSSSSSAPASAGVPSTSTEQVTSSMPVPPDLLNHPSITKHGHTRYQFMLMPTPPGKRPERYRFNLSALFTEDGMEYSVQEVRARSMGLLGKKWGPPPPSEMQRFASPPSLGSSSSSAAASQPKASMRRRGYDESERTVQGRGYVGGYAEPTVTLATKEALADVFGMYNSPEKTMGNGPAAGSKYAPVRRIEPITPAGGGTLQSALRQAKADENAKTPMQVFRDENAKTPLQVFRDENAGMGRNAKENAIVPGVAKFSVFTDPSALSQTPSLGREPRRALTTKDPTTPAAQSDENGGPVPRIRKGPSALSNITEDEREESQPAPPAEERKVFTVFTPAAPSENRPSPFKVFSRPPSANAMASSTASTDDNASAPAAAQRKPAFTAFVDSFASASAPPAPAPEQFPPSSRPPLGERSHTPLQSWSTPSTSTDSSDADGAYPMAMGSGEYYDESGSSSDLDDPPLGMDVGVDALDAHTPAHSDAEQEYEDEYYAEEAEEEVRSGRAYQGRLGRFNLMTPITERTQEYTSNGQAPSARGTPGSVSLHRAYTHRGLEAAQENAEMLAAELREDDEWEDEEEDVGMVEERTGTLSLSDAIARASSFAPPNPCNPFEGTIIASLLSIIPVDAGFYDLRAYESGRLDSLQKFARRRERKSSGNSSRGSAVELGGQRYDVVAKLGEGGFGAVFEAVDVDAAAQKRGRHVDVEDEDDFDDEDDEDEIPKVALKVVKPRSIWEFHVLRRIHHTVSSTLKRSIITPSTLYAFKDESFLVLELRKQGTLLDIVNRAPQAGITQQGACLDELLVMFFSIELLRLLEGLHSAGFIHGDVKIDNCLLRLEDVPGPAAAWSATYDPTGEGGWCYKGIKMIDFGRTIDAKLFPPNQQFTGDWPTDARDCLEMREGRPWTYQTDYFGLAGIIYCMLYGKYIEASSVVPAPLGPNGQLRYKLSSPFKRYWQGELWTRMFDLLLNPTLVHPDGQLPLCGEMGALREEMEVWLKANCNRASNTLKGLLKKIGLAILGGKDGRKST
ncbi:hypothetical protein PHLGIDRAFT_30737 [Phlebiopsis gigantea 11061_1 CR5-6]|uniref:Protein kinase domain-containing protein n=1 Tax=Phlebiopsis gigantea (strain 11061_1 CR5-6) TaxID=745531 RepID=A0A0C3S937_PHLG1|nr:hypothetical protein PHLGIDRAFT_30737 [Phlebiopsis gigantea 11061_1 CR5-6]